MNGAKQVIDFRASKGFTVSQSNEHLRVYSDKTLKHALSIGASQSESQQILQLVVSRIQMKGLKNLGSEQW